MCLLHQINKKLPSPVYWFCVCKAILVNKYTKRFNIQFSCLVLYVLTHMSPDNLQTYLTVQVISLIEMPSLQLVLVCSVQPLTCTSVAGITATPASKQSKQWQRLTSASLRHSTCRGPPGPLLHLTLPHHLLLPLPSPRRHQCEQLYLTFYSQFSLYIYVRGSSRK